jgi:hypothetical protein
LPTGSPTSFAEVVNPISYFIASSGSFDSYFVFNGQAIVEGGDNAWVSGGGVAGTGVRCDTASRIQIQL